MVGVAPPTMEQEVQQEREKLQLLVSAFSNAQQDQYEIYRRSTFPKASMRKLMQNVCGGTVPQNAVIAMAGITKVRKQSMCSVWTRYAGKKERRETLSM